MSAQGRIAGTCACRHGRRSALLAPEVVAHLATCADCRRFRDETLALDARLRAALELPVARFRRRAPPARRFALAASVLLALFIGGGFWLLRPQSALAGEVAEHVRHEPGSWDQSTQDAAGAKSPPCSPPPGWNSIRASRGVCDDRARSMAGACRTSWCRPPRAR